MADQKKNNSKKVVRFRKKIHINIGIIVFAVILIYFGVYVISYAVRNHTVAYEVQMGEITESSSHTGLALRTESVIKAESGGSVNYYYKEGAKVAYDDNVCSIDANGSISEKITAAGSDISSLSEDELTVLRKYITDFAAGYSNANFDDVYEFKSVMNSTIREELYQDALEEYASELESASASGSFSFIQASEPGLVEYYVDGYEGMTTSSFKETDYDPAGYKATNLKDVRNVSAGDALYKLLTDENWNMIVPITQEEKERYNDYSVILVTFQKDNRSCYATFEIKDFGNNPYLFLAFNSSMVRYAADRYIDVTLDINTSRGLKIPKSAVVEKTFFLIPEEYVTRGNNSSQQGVLLEKSGTRTPEFTPVTIYNSKDGYYYISSADFAAQDQIRKPESDESYTLEQTETLKGVYNINKGYAVFRQIEILAENSEYAIVQTGSDYGLSMYDHIALNGDEIKEGDLIK